MVVDHRVSGRWELPSRAASVAEARSAARAFLAGRRPVLDPDATLLVVSELVSNAVVHAGSDMPVQLRIDLGADSVHIEVEDGDPNPPRQRDAGPDDAAGRGLLIVDNLADRWGWDALQAKGKRVWCDMPLFADT